MGRTLNLHPFPPPTSPREETFTAHVQQTKYFLHDSHINYTSKNTKLFNSLLLFHQNDIFQKPPAQQISKQKRGVYRCKVALQLRVPSKHCLPSSITSVIDEMASYNNPAESYRGTLITHKICRIPCLCTLSKPSQTTYHLYSSLYMINASRINNCLRHRSYRASFS